MATKPKDFGAPQRIEAEFYRSITQLIYSTAGITKNSTPLEILEAFANISSNREVLERLASHLAQRMITQLRVSNARSWREAARQACRGREIYEALQNEMHTGVGARVRELVSENAAYISSIPAKVREESNHEILRMEQEGSRPEAISAFLRKRIPQLTRHRAALIARTETGKAATALTRARAEALNINWYEWRTSEDSRVRPSHRLMDKVLVNWNDPPNPESLAHEQNHHGTYHAGNIYNCRCDSYPLLSLDQLHWPAKVFYQGKIQRMTLGHFEAISGVRRRIAA